MGVYTKDQMNEALQKLTLGIRCQARLTTSLVGGMSASREGVRLFVEHHLKLEGQQAEDAISRILKEEIPQMKPLVGETPQLPDQAIGTQVVSPPDGELQEKLSYGVYIIRRDEHGPWLGDWMVKAMLKAATSRLGFFVTKRGSKGDLAEMGMVRAIGHSLRNPEQPRRLYITDTAGNPAKTEFEQFKGRVQLAGGSASIVSDREVVAPGALLEFEFRLYEKTKLKESDLVKVFAAAMNIGLGSAKAFERGKFEILSLEIDDKKDEE